MVSSFFSHAEVEWYRPERAIFTLHLHYIHGRKGRMRIVEDFET
jgi:hypothetical protein